MKPGILSKLTSVPMIVGAGIALAALYGCARLRPAPAPNAPPVAKIKEPLLEPVDAPSHIKMSDFRLNPPKVENIRIKKLSGKNVLFMVRFAPDRRLGTQITVRPENPVTLHDDGRDGDQMAGDREFSAIVPMNFEAFAAQELRVASALEKKGKPVVVRTFKGREVVKSQRFQPSELLDKFRNKDFIDLIQIGGDTVDEKRSLMITDKLVVEDPKRTFNPCAQGAANPGTPMGKWTFGYLVTQLANEPVTGINASDFTLLWLRHWLTDQSVNGFTAPNRAQRMQTLINNWPKLPDGRLDLAKAPMKLLAIVNRIDLASNLAYGNGNGGEGRFVFGVLDACSVMQFTIIFEFGVPKRTCPEIKEWANLWLNLGTKSLTDPTFNDDLEFITEQFAKANSDPSKPNGSALNQLRTDEIALGQPWELREFRIFSSDSDAGLLRQVTVKQTPDRAAYNIGGAHEAALAKWINDNSPAIKQDKHTVPVVLPFPSLEFFLGGFSPNGNDFWNATGIADLDARFHFSLNTCNACHGTETGTGFTHVHPAPFGSEAGLSGFLIGNGAGGDFIVNDPVAPGTTHAFNDLARRAQVLHDFATQDCLVNLRFQPVLMPH